ncbi:hypothetical protein [Variovorax sp. E3]|uniref:hypothetical protein n=1 Tax=Variovorax sp. E3 TaxID=1914993 RepID=UPI0022B6DF9B|nr:hypothetical protein [Variovorax sp. E3]
MPTRPARLVRLADLRGEVSDASTLRMVVSRAFRDFKAGTSRSAGARTRCASPAS